MASSAETDVQVFDYVICGYVMIALLIVVTKLIKCLEVALLDV